MYVYTCTVPSVHVTMYVMYVLLSSSRSSTVDQHSTHTPTQKNTCDPNIPNESSDHVPMIEARRHRVLLVLPFHTFLCSGACSNSQSKCTKALSTSSKLSSLICKLSPISCVCFNGIPLGNTTSTSTNN